MGQSTDATLFYGYCWDDERRSVFEEDYDSDKEWVEVVAHRRGIPDPWDYYRSSGAEADHKKVPYNQQNIAYRDWKRQVGFDALLDTWRGELDKIKAEYGGVDISSHCSCDYPMPYIYIEDSELTANRGMPVAVPSTHLDRPMVDWDADLTRFVNELDIDISEAQGPGWFLVSNWC